MCCSELVVVIQSLAVREEAKIVMTENPGETEVIVALSVLPGGTNSPPVLPGTPFDVVVAA